MSFRARNLPVELLSQIIRTVSKEDLCQLRTVNSTFNQLATPALFENITVSNNYTSADRLWTVLHTPHIAQHVRSLTYAESRPQLQQRIEARDLPNRRSVQKRLEAAFALLHRAPVLKTLALFFKSTFIYRGTIVDTNFCRTYSHMWDIVAALGSNQNPLPQLQSLTIRPWLGDPKRNSLYDAKPFALLVTSLRHLSFSVSDVNLWDPRALSWKPVVRMVLQHAIRLESLAIEGMRKNEFVGVSDFATYPGMAALSLTNVFWEDGEIGHEGVVKPPAVEDFITRHRKTLKTLKLHNCEIGVLSGRTTPLCYWADVYDRLAKALTELVELEVVFHVDTFRTQYTYLGPRPSNRSPVETLDRTEQDGLSLEKFKAVVKNRGTGADSRPQL